MKMKKIYKLIISLLIPQLAGGLGSFFTVGSVKDWYPAHCLSNGLVNILKQKIQKN